MRMEWQMGGLGLELSRGTDARLRTLQESCYRNPVLIQGDGAYVCILIVSLSPKKEKERTLQLLLFLASGKFMTTV